jgi:hypothetical protein
VTDPTSQSPDQAALSARAKAARRQSQIILLVVVALLIGVSFFTWKKTWFGGDLNDSQITEYLGHKDKIRDIQHALNVLEKRIEDNDPDVKRWYPQIIVQSSNPQPEVRLMAAWVMGQDNKSEEFHAALLPLLNDPTPLVRRNAALGLVRFNDPRAKPELVAMLHPYDVKAPVAGRVTTAFRNGDTAGVGVLLASIRQENGSDAEIRSPMKGDIRSLLSEGTKVAAGDVVLSLGPDQAAVSSALTALALIGDSDNVPDVEHIVTGEPNMSKSIKDLAARTADALRNRQPKAIAN